MANLLTSTRNYVYESALAFGEGWNEFWLRPRDPANLGRLRIGVGLLVLVWLLSFAPDLGTLFSFDGLLPTAGVTDWEQDTVFREQFAFSDSSRRGLSPSPRLSILALSEASGELWTALIACAVVVALFTAGVFTRITGVLALVAFLSFVNRAPLLCGPFEAVAAMLMFYLALSPCGATHSFDRWRALRKGSVAADPANVPATISSWRHAPPRWSATVTLRLIQVHLCAIYVFMALAQWGGGGGETPWATGDAIWLLAARPTAGLSFRWLASAPVLIDLWTHGMWIFEFAFPLAIWARRARPALLVLAALVWLAFGCLTGQFAFCLLMIVATWAFWPERQVAAAV